VWASDRVQHLRLPEPWPGLASIACVRRVREVIGGDGSDERSYYVSSIRRPGAAAFAEAIRGHWGIENRLHWHLDVSFGEDACRVRKGHGAENFSRLRRIALNLLQRESTNRRGIKIKRQRAGWDHDYLLRVLTGGVCDCPGPTQGNRHVNGGIAVEAASLAAGWGHGLRTAPAYAPARRLPAPAGGLERVPARRRPAAGVVR
jgi:predicted transposase YbfD/YdcC